MWTSVRKGRTVGCKVLFAIVIPFPGTDLYRQCLEKGIIADEEAYWVELHWDEGRRNMTRRFKTLRRALLAMSTVSDLSELWERSTHLSGYSPRGLATSWRYIVGILRRYRLLAVEAAFGFVRPNEHFQSIAEDTYHAM
jgi:hypothetical protein